MDKLTLFRGIPIQQIYDKKVYTTINVENLPNIGKFKPNRDLRSLVLTGIMDSSALLQFTNNNKPYNGFLIEGFIVWISPDTENINKTIPNEVKLMKNGSRYTFYWFNSLSSWIKTVTQSIKKDPWNIVKHKGVKLSEYRDKMLKLIDEPQTLIPRKNLRARNPNINYSEDVSFSEVLSKQAKMAYENMLNMIDFHENKSVVDKIYDKLLIDPRKVRLFDLNLSGSDNEETEEETE